MFIEIYLEIVPMNGSIYGKYLMRGRFKLSIEF
jgi:hypothetical protein